MLQVGSLPGFFPRVGAAERCTESIFTDHQRQVCDYALVYAEKKNDGEAPYSVSFTATQSGDVIVQLHPHSQLERAVRHERQAQAPEPPASASPAAPPAPAEAGVGRQILLLLSHICMGFLTFCPSKTKSNWYSKQLSPTVRLL